ncbi:MAG: imidazolonepropionase [Flavobacteriaceae bacterium]
MSCKVFINIKQLLQVETTTQKSKIAGQAMKDLPSINNAYLRIQNDTISDFGEMANFTPNPEDELIDCSGKIILPTWYDSHTHIVYAGNREQEFVDRINGMSYEEIANNGGGILNSAKKLQHTAEEDLYQQSAERLEEVIKLGTGGIEIKSGYGLTVDAELKMLRVIKRLKQNYSIPIKATFLGAHAIPKEYKDNKQGYLDLIITKMLPAIAKEQLAEYIDIFCESGYFTVEDTEQILAAGSEYGLTAKIHVNQFNSIGGIQKGIAHNALTVDHLEVLTPEDLEALKSSETMPVALPSCSYFLSIPYTPAREIIDNGLALALATDYNPGSTPSGNMNFVVSTACIKMKMTPEEAINAATINGAYAMGISNTHGSIAKGKFANIIITKSIKSYNVLPYSFGTNNIDSVYINGQLIQ